MIPFHLVRWMGSAPLSHSSLSSHKRLIQTVEQVGSGIRRIRERRPVGGAEMILSENFISNIWTRPAGERLRRPRGEAMNAVNGNNAAACFQASCPAIALRRRMEKIEKRLG